MPGSETRFAVLLFTDIVGSTDLKARHGVPAYGEALRTHNAHFERIARECHGIRILQNMGDGYFAEAGGVAEAVKFALLFQDAMREGPWNEVRLTTCVGIHAGEIGVVDSAGGSGIVAPAADLAARITDLAVGGQILLTRFPFDEARHFIREHPTVAGKTMPPLRWLAHGPYLLKGRDEPLEIFEVGVEGLAPLAAPPDREKAKHAIRPGEEETLGWRPAVGLEIPGRTGWHLTERLGAGGFGEVWVGEHAKLHQRRAFKFCFDDERLRALKREVTLVRLLRSALGERDDIVHLHELKLDAPPFYLESDLAPHGNLLQWAARQGGLEKIPLAQRIALVAHTATALAAAHSIGVLHKDIKPTNILIFDGPNGEPRPRLVDFGIGTLANPSVLGEHGVTAAGFTRATVVHSTGTPTYSPPEYLAGKPYTIQGDIYGLGVLLYQLIVAKPNEPLAQGWERDVSDPLLREDIVLCVDGDPAHRLPSATDLAERLLTLELRRVEIEEKERLVREAAARAEIEAAATASRLRATRLRKLAAVFAILALLALAGGLLAWMNQRKATALLDEVENKKAEVDRKNNEQRTMLIEAARSDRVAADNELRTDQEREAFVHLARSCESDPRSTFAAEKAVAALNTWRHPLPMAVLSGDSMWTAQFSPDGTRIVTAKARGRTAQVWNVTTGTQLATFEGHKDRVQTAQFSPDGKRIVTASSDKTARVWDAATGKELAKLVGHESYVRTAQFSPNGSRVVTGSGDKTARVWEVATGKSLVTLAGHKDTVNTAQFSPDGKQIVTDSQSPSADTSVWDTVTGEKLATLPVPNQRDPQFGPDGTRILTESGDGTVRVWDAATGKNLVTLAWQQNPQFSPDGTRIVASDQLMAQVWDAGTGKSLTTLAGHKDTVLTVRFSPDGTRVLTGSSDKSVWLWDAATGKRLAALSGHEGRVECARFSPDGTRIFTASGDNARVWDAVLDVNSVTLAGHKRAVETAQFSPDGRGVLTTSGDATARIWDADTGKSFAKLGNHDEAAADIGELHKIMRQLVAKADEQRKSTGKVDAK